MRSAWRKAKGWLSATFLRWSIALKPEAFNAWIHERVTAATFQSVQAYFKQRGIYSCEVCTSTRGPLRKVGPWISCPDHRKTLEDRWEKQRAADQAEKAQAQAKEKMAA